MDKDASIPPLKSDQGKTAESHDKAQVFMETFFPAPAKPTPSVESSVNSGAPETGQTDYTNPNAYRPISLLNTLGKLLEAVIAKRLSYYAEKHRTARSSCPGNFAGQGRRGNGKSETINTTRIQVVVHTV